MDKRYRDKRCKFTCNTYMREATYYDIHIFKESDYFVTVKKYKKVSDKFCLNGVVYIDNGYYLVEITPMNENYNIRFYYDNKKKFIDYYVDITLENGVKYMIPYYIDLYLDIVHYGDGSVGFVDEDEMCDALNKGIISKRDYDMAYGVGNRLLDEIRENKNKYLKIDVLEYINRVF